MVIRIPGIQLPKPQAWHNAQESKGASTGMGPQPGPDPAWARFNRTPAPVQGAAGSVSLQAYKPDVAAYRVLGRDPLASAEPPSSGHPERRDRNAHNSSVYVSQLGLQQAQSSPGRNAKMTRLPVIGEIAAG